MSSHGQNSSAHAAVIVAHPDDETIWCGGLILSRPDLNWFVLSLCRGDDEDRAPRFRRALLELGATGDMADLNDGPTQEPLDPCLLRDVIRRKLPSRHYELIVTHNPKGEYSKHLRHEECAKNVIFLWSQHLLHTTEMKLFAYADQGPHTLPRPRADAHERLALSRAIYDRKKNIVNKIYGFGQDSWESRTTGPIEAFYRARSASEFREMLAVAEETPFALSKRVYR